MSSGAPMHTRILLSYAYFFVRIALPPDILKVHRSWSDYLSSSHGKDISLTRLFSSGRLTGSAKHAYAIGHLLPFLKPGARVLDIGSGSGYLCAVLHHLVSPPPSSTQPNPVQGKVIGIDHIPELVEWSKKNLEKDGLGPAVRDGRIEMIATDGRQGEFYDVCHLWLANIVFPCIFPGYPLGGPYDAIHVGAASPTLPQALVDQLKSPGKMFIPVGVYSQAIWEIEKTVTGEVQKRRVMDVM
ncbi:hypothetical protein ID866_4117, partial [Astraeus odoratus]